MNRRRIAIVLLAALVLIGLGWKVAGHAASAFITLRFGAKLLALAEGKFTDPQSFVTGLLGDAAWLAVVLCLIALAFLALEWAVNRKVLPRYRWIGGSILGFTAVNVFVLAASHTALFWCALYTGKGHITNYTQFQIKSNLMKEIQAPAQAVLLGNSQTQAQIDEKILNRRLGKALWTTELHFPGSHAYDMTLTFRSVPPVPLKFVICYLTEGYFFTGLDSEGLMSFLKWADLPAFYRYGGSQYALGQKFYYGLLGDAVPLFRFRESLMAPLFGAQMMNLGQQKYDATLETDLSERAQRAKAGFHSGPNFEFQKNSLLALAEACRARHCVLILCAGQMNPLLGSALDPVLRRQMLAFLRELAARDPNVVLLDEAELPRQTAEDYVDLMHAGEASQARFSEYLAGVLERLLSQPEQIPERKP